MEEEPVFAILAGGLYATMTKNLRDECPWVVGEKGKLPIFIAIHKWKKEDFPKIGKAVIETLAKLPEEMCILASWIDADMAGAWCIWEAKSGPDLQKLLRGAIPDTVVKPVLRWYPPTEDLYQMIHQLLG